MQKIKKPLMCNILSQWCTHKSQGVGSKRTENAPPMNTHKLKIATALAMLLQVPEGIADVSIRGQLEVTFVETESSSNTHNALHFSASENLGQGMTITLVQSNSPTGIPATKRNLAEYVSGQRSFPTTSVDHSSAPNIAPNATLEEFDALVSFFDKQTDTAILPTVFGNTTFSRTANNSIHVKVVDDSNTYFINHSGVTSIGESLSNQLSILRTASSMPTMALHGAHHLPLLSQKKLSGENCAWINGDFANYHEKKADSTLVEAGFCKDLEESTRAGLGIGKSKANQTLDYSGSSEIDGKYLLLELDHQVQDSPMLLSATLLHGNWDAGINRGYLNAGTEDQSRGSTSIKATAIRARVDWRELYSLGGVTFTPKIEYTLTRSHVDGYTETTGGFPARFDPQSHTARESRIGLIIEKDLDAQTTVRGITEAVHRFDKNGANFSGEVVGLFPFSIPGSENRQDWIRLGGEIDHQIDKDSFVSFSLMRSSKGEDADVSGAVSWKGNF